MPELSDNFRAAALLAGLVALGGLGVWSTTQPLEAPRPALASIDDIPLLVSTPQAAFPQPVFDAENAIPLEARLARWDKLIDEAAKRFDVPRDWIVAVMRQEFRAGAPCCRVIFPSPRSRVRWG